MRVFVAGATGAAGRPVVRRLVAAGHEVTGMTRTPAKIPDIEAQGARGVVADALDAARVQAAVAGAAPEAIVQLLTALPKRGPMRDSDLAATNELRAKGTAALVAAASAAGVKRYVSESIVLAYAPAARPVTEDDPVVSPSPGAPFAASLAALASLESQVLGIGGIVLRFGLYYGPTSGSTEFMRKMLRRRLLRLPRGDGAMPWIHLEDAASAVLAALERGAAGEVYNIVDDEPAGAMDIASEMARVLGVRPPKTIPARIVRIFAPYLSGSASQRLSVSNAKAKADLGWKPAYPTFREGLRAPAEP